MHPHPRTDQAPNFFTALLTLAIKMRRIRGKRNEMKSIHSYVKVKRNENTLAQFI